MGGVVGDDGVEGIQIGELGDGPAYLELQLWLRELRRRGVLLAVCSKNDEAVAREPFERHADMALRLDDFAMFVANWEDKAANVRRIRETLDIGLDSIVFLDDNPFERDQVRAMLPEVTVPELPADPADRLTYLRSLDLFETASHSDADAGRTAQYQAAARRSEMRASFDSYEDYLDALEMVATAAPFDDFHMPRVAQLTQRSNQFNLRTVRYTEEQVRQAAADPARITRYYTLEDRLGDHGLIGVVILDRREGGELFVSEWLMSCRVLRRTMEEFIVNDIVAAAREAGATTVVGEYLPTPKNAMVADLYPRMGFTEGDDGLFRLDVSTFEGLKTSIRRKEG